MNNPINKVFLQASVWFLVFGAAAQGVAQGADACFGIVPANAKVTPLRASGIPFLQFAPANIAEGKTVEWPLPSIVADRLFLIGMINSPDETHPAWGGGDSFRNFFIGDSAGTFVLTYASGRRDEVPLIFGYTVGWRRNFSISPAPFSTDNGARARLDAAMYVLNGRDAYKNNDPLCLCVVPRREPLVSVELIDNSNKLGCVALQGVTVVAASNGLQTNAALTAIGGLTLTSEQNDWLKTHLVTSANPFPSARRRALENLRDWLYTTPASLTSEKVRLAAASVQTSTNHLPAISFRGPVEAQIMTEVYRENSAELLTRIGSDGMVRESNPTADNYNGFGGYTPRLGAFKNDYYTRNWAPTLLNNWGCFEQGSASLEFFDRWMMYFPQSYPKLQIGGKPVPGHATVICNEPHVYFDKLRHVGWPTRFTTRDMGNPETDGHGFMMLNHYNAWVKTGRSTEWVKQHWAALEAAAEFIPWQLDNPKLSFSEHRLLYAESEGGMDTESIYCNVPCWLGLLEFAEMADAVGKTEKAMRWRSYAGRLQKAMEAYFPKNLEPWGDVWDPDKTAKWGNYPISALAVVIFGGDYWGLDLRGHMPNGWAERNEHTWKLAISGTQPHWCAPAGCGYGQASYAIAGLLLDQTEDSDKIVNWMARMIFAPRQPHSFRVPEGMVIASDRSVWRRWGDLGNLFQMGAVLRAIQVMCGVDDLSVSGLRIIPRIPKDWEGLEMENMPVRTLSGGQSRLMHVALNYSRDHEGRKIKMRLTPDLPLDRVDLRLGPMASDHLAASCDHHPVEARAEFDGDSCWGWLTLTNLPPGKHEIVLKTKKGD